MKKSLFVLIAFVLIIAGCGQGNGGSGSNPSPSPGESPSQGSEPNEPAEEVSLKVGASSVPHAEILNFIISDLKEQGVNLDIIEFSDYIQPNVQLYEGELDANFFQHEPYLDQFNADNNYDLVNAAGVHIEPFGVYSKKIQSLDKLQDGANIAIPNDPSNGGRALILLAQHDLIVLDEEAGVDVTLADIKENPRNFQFVELEAASLPRMLDEFDIATINTNYALQADLNPVEDAIVIEDADSPYVNILAVRADNQDSEAIQKLVEALKTPEVEQFINDTYEGAVVPAFQ